MVKTRKDEDHNKDEEMDTQSLLGSLPSNAAQGTLLVGLSGGPDSVALLHLLCEAGYRPVATHCNFHLRGAESDRDEAFCRRLCQELGVTLLVRQFDTRGYMAAHHVSLELAARNLRYDWWQELLQTDYSGSASYIALAHHQDDSIETLLFNLMRGTGIRGLTGIPATHGRIVRPLLRLTRRDIMDYLQSHGYDYIVDSTNLENEATRNKIRNLLLPLMESINPSARHGIAMTMGHLQQTCALADERLQELFADATRCCEGGVEWYEYRTADVSLYHYWQEMHPRARIKGNLFYTEPNAEQLARQTCDYREEVIEAPLPPFNPDYELFDADRVRLPLHWRHWQEGDRIQPLGMLGSKLVSDLFTNAHYTPVRKLTTWLLTDASGRILWVTGLRVAEWCKVTDQTRRAIKVSPTDR